MRNKVSGLTLHFGLLLLLAMAIASLAFVVLRFGGAIIMERALEHSDFQQQNNVKRIRSFQAYIEKHNLSARDAAQIKRWEKTQPLMLLEIYRSNTLLYTSSASEDLAESDIEVPQYAWVSYYAVTFSDGDADVVIYADDSYRFYSILTTSSLLLSMVLFLFVFLYGSQELIKYICVLSHEIKAMEGGNLDVPITIRGKHELASLAKSLDSMRKAFKEQIEQESATYQANQTMITQMSHDLRTPMTALQIYTDILKYNRCTPEQIPDYLKKIDGKVAQIKQLSENLFEYSLIPREHRVILEDPCSFRDVFHDLLSESAVYLSEHEFRSEIGLEWPPVQVRVYSPYIKRILDNVSSNIIKYASKDSPVQIGTGLRNDMVFLRFQNRIARNALAQEGTHIGIPNIRTMIEKMGGKCLVTHTDSTFQLELFLPVVYDEQE